MNPWSPYKPTAEAPWNLMRVVHLHRRAAFAAPWDVIQRDLRDGPEIAVDRILNARQHKDEHFESLAESIGSAAVASGNSARLKAWWIYRMLLTPDPLGERLTLMWHNHFATSNLKVDNLVYMHQQNQQLREFGRDKFQSLLACVLKHPAMLTWLDADANSKGHPNENLARELMELFTLGIGNYTEPDVREAARSLTGWTVKDDAFALSANRHDVSEKTVLGRTAAFEGDSLIEHLCQQPATARRIAWRLCQTFLGEDVANEDSVTQLAEVLRASSLDLDAAVSLILRSQLFFSEANIRTRISGPVEFVIGAFRSLHLNSPPPSTLSLAEWLSRMGQDLFYPPNVGGWTEGRSWLSTRNIIARANFAHALVQGEHWNPVIVPDWSQLPLKPGDVTEVQIRKLGELSWGEIDETLIQEVTAMKRSSDIATTGDLVEILLSHPSHSIA
jgi:uncharacterized protein (DUF1800 family)